MKNGGSFQFAMLVITRGYVEIRWHSSHPAALGKSSYTAAWNRHGPKPWEIGEPGPMTSPWPDDFAMWLPRFSRGRLTSVGYLHFKTHPDFGKHPYLMGPVIWPQASSVWEDLITGQGTTNSSDFNLVWIPISPYALAIFVAVTQPDLPLVVSPNCGVFVAFSSFLSVWFQISWEVLTSPSFPIFSQPGLSIGSGWTAGSSSTALVCWTNWAGRQHGMSGSTCWVRTWRSTWDGMQKPVAHVSRGVKLHNHMTKMILMV